MFMPVSAEDGLVWRGGLNMFMADPILLNMSMGLNGDGGLAEDGDRLLGKEVGVWGCLLAVLELTPVLVPVGEGWAPEAPGPVLEEAGFGGC